MQSLLQVAQEEKGGGASAPLPGILPILTQRGIVPERGQMMMIAAQPNGGKSMLSLWYAATAGVRTFVFSADTDKRTTMYRAAAIRTGLTFNEVKAMTGTSAAGIYEEAVEELTSSGMRFDFNPNPSIRDLDLELQAYEEIYGAPPELIVIDNLLNIANDAGDFNGLVEILGQLHAMARSLDAALIILHHVNESTSKPEYPASRSSIRGKVSQYPEQIISIAMVPEENIMRVAVVKHRHAQPSPSGEDYETIWVDPTRMTFYNTRTDFANAQTRREWE